MTLTNKTDCKGRFDAKKGIMKVDLNCPICVSLASNLKKWGY